MKKVLLCIMDGVGERNEIHGNAVKKANTPNLDYLKEKYSYSLLEASGPFVGLPEGQMGNSEVGHMNIGTGRIISQSIDRITNAIMEGSLKENLELNSLIKHTKENNSNLHLCGLISDGGIHSHINHLLGIIDILKEKNVTNVYYHIFTDGRDTLPDSSLKYIKKLEEKINSTGIGKISTISGRYYAMDRDNRWDRIEKTYKEMTEETLCFESPEELIKQNYGKGITDEFIVPGSINNGIIKDNDGVLVFNFRPDRLRELFTALSNENFKEFETKKFNNLKLVTMMPVDENVKCTNLFKHEKINNYLGKILEKNNLRQLRIAETEKYAHVTYFFDGESKEKLNGCNRILIPSPKVSTYDLKPEMSAFEITETLLQKIEDYDVIILNYANGDMVGHTGDFNATVKAVEVVDECVGKLYKKIKEIGGVMLVTADHGNSDYMLDEKGNVITSHSLSKVPFIITDENIKVKDGKLSDIAPTILTLLNIEIPSEMTGEVLIEK